MPHLCVLSTQPHICAALDGKIPLFALTGIFHHFTLHFLSAVFYATYDQNFLSESEERAGCWVGFWGTLW